MTVNLNDFDSLDSESAVEFNKDKFERQKNKWPKVLKQALVMNMLGKDLIKGLSSITKAGARNTPKQKKSGKRIK